MLFNVVLSGYNLVEIHGNESCTFNSKIVILVQIKKLLFVMAIL